MQFRKKSFLFLCLILCICFITPVAEVSTPMYQSAAYLYRRKQSRDNKKYKQYFKKNIMNRANNKNKLPVNYDSELYFKFGAKHYNRMHNILSHAPFLERKVWEKYENSLKVIDSNSDGRAYCRGTLGVVLNVDKDFLGDFVRNPYQTTFHEFGHNIDFLANYELGDRTPVMFYSYYYKDNLLGKTIKKEVNDKLSEISSAIESKLGSDYDADDWMSDNDISMNEAVPTDYPEFAKLAAEYVFINELKSNDYFGVFVLSDIVQGATNGKVSIGGGHGTDYWLEDEKNLTCEAFANMFESSVTNKVQINFVKKYLPESYKVYQEILKSMLDES